MRYRINPKNGDRLSQLGLGAMRLPRKGSRIDQEKANALIARAAELGVNYFDTAYIYPGSEEALGEALRTGGLRGKVHIATKLPLHMVRTAADIDRLFGRQLERLQTDRIDYYLLHMLANPAALRKMELLGIVPWIDAKKKAGQIRNIGFSFHGGRQDFEALLSCYPWDFCMIQYNYMDEHNQAGRAGLCRAAEMGLPVFVMEPLRGGMLVNGLPEAARQAFAGADAGRSLADWGLRWVFNHSEVTLALSGMGDLAQLEENIRIADACPPGCLTDAERAAYGEALSAINSAIRVPCTGCGYCLPCPRGVDIPTCFACYNEKFTRGRVQAVKHYVMHTGALYEARRFASNCIQCRACEARCPQGIKIADKLRDASRALESFWFRPAMGVARRVTKGKGRG